MTTVLHEVYISRHRARFPRSVRAPDVTGVLPLDPPGCAQQKSKQLCHETYTRAELIAVGSCWGGAAMKSFGLQVSAVPSVGSPRWSLARGPRPRARRPRGTRTGARKLVP